MVARYPQNMPPELCSFLDDAGISYASITSTLNYAWQEGIRFEGAYQYFQYFCHHTCNAEYLTSKELYRIVQHVFNLMTKRRPDMKAPLCLYEMKGTWNAPVFDVGKVKLYDTCSGSTWGQRLRHVKDFPDHELIVCTYSLNDPQYIRAILGNRRNGYNVHLICHSKFADEACWLKHELPDMEVYLRPDVHAKIVLFAPEVVLLGSDNFGKGGYFNVVTEFRSGALYQEIYNRLCRYLNIEKFDFLGGDL